MAGISLIDLSKIRGPLLMSSLSELTDQTKPDYNSTHKRIHVFTVDSDRTNHGVEIKNLWGYVLISLSQAKYVDGGFPDLALLENRRYS